MAIPLQGGRSLDLQALTTLYQCQGFIHLPGLLSPAHADQLYATTHNVKTTRVKCGFDAIRFAQQSFGDEHAIGRFLADGELRRLVLALTGGQTIQRIQCWTSLYRRGEFIEPHTDGSGSMQVVVCLRAPSAETNGGHLVLRPNMPQQVILGLRAGDAVAFEAIAVRHCTLPLTGSPDEPDPVRVVAVGRYFVA